MIVFPGKVIGTLTVLKFAHKTHSRGHFQWLCRCSCGNEKLIREDSLRTGVTKSCGRCNLHIKHPNAYSSWFNMWTRCTNENYHHYFRYGGRGIRVCIEWTEFNVFLADMGDPPYCELTGNRYTLDRIDNNGNYTKENCRWASKFTQVSNK